MPSSTPPSVQPAPNVQPVPSSAGQSTRIDVREIKFKIFKRIGPERARKYFQHLERFLSSRLSKNEFEKLCLVALGSENLPLHNHLIRSILHNASRACGPPIISDPKLVKGATSDHAFVPPVWDNGSALNQDVKENKSSSRRENALTQKSSLNHCETIRENGVHHLSDLKRCTQVQKGDHVEPLMKRPHLEMEPFSLHSLQSNGSALPSGENLGREMIHQSQGPVQVQAPLGIQLRAGSFAGLQKPFALASVSSKDTSDTCIEFGEICDTLLVKKRMDKIAESEGLEGVSIECANLLNNVIDVFIKQLIGSCVELVTARSQLGKLRNEAWKQQLRQKLINGASLQNHIPGQGGIIPPEKISISMQDLKAVMELNTRLLGVNASLLLEKINSYD